MQIFLLWGIWWTLSLFWSYLRDGPRYRARSWCRFPGPVVALEPVLKVLGPCFCFYMELKGHHQYFRCETAHTIPNVVLLILSVRQ